MGEKNEKKIPLHILALFLFSLFCVMVCLFQQYDSMNRNRTVHVTQDWAVPELCIPRIVQGMQCLLLKLYT